MIKRVLITGGAGFIGSHLADELLAHGYRVKALDSLSAQVHGAERQRPPYLDQAVEVVPKDLRDPEALDQALRDVEAVFHFAAAVGVGQSMYEIEKYTSDNDLATGVLDVPVERIYWYSARDLDPEFPSKEGFHADDRDYHFGLFASDGTPKLLSRLWAGGGLEAVAPALETHPGVRRNAAKPVPPVVITGGAGFIGTNLADRLLSDGERVLIFDNLSRPGVQKLYEWLRETRGLHQGLSDGARSRASAACRKTVDRAITTIDERA